MITAPHDQTDPASGNRFHRCPGINRALVAALVLTTGLTACGLPSDRKGGSGEAVDWAQFLSRHDMVWEQLPPRWQDAPFLGNGMLGTMMRQTGERTVRFDVQRGDVQDHRPLQRDGVEISTMFARCRLPIGYFELKTAGAITGGSIRLDLWNAEARGVVVTEEGEIAWRSYVHAEEMVIRVELEPTQGERSAGLEWKPLPAVSPRYARNKRIDGGGGDYPESPEPVLSHEGEIGLCTQPLRYGGETVTAWTLEKQSGKSVLTVTVAHSHPESTAGEEALRVIRNVGMQSAESLETSHRAWWHAFYPQSFLSIPDSRWESFYWIQMYKLASATRADRMVIDNQGPWLQPTAWPGIWWNLNLQLTYWPTYTSNRLDLGASLNRAMEANFDQLVANVAEPYRHDSASLFCATGQDFAGPVYPPDEKRTPMMGCLLWGLHNCWLHYRHTMDDEALGRYLLPLLKRAVNYYYHFITVDEAGVMHLPRTFSPEYKAGKGPDTNFELALLRWGCATLIEGYGRLGIDDPLLPKWRETLERLAPYPVDENGYMIAAGVPFNHKHRHYSHLLMLYPLYLVNADQPGAEELAMKSVRHWQSLGASHGYSVTGASSMFASFGHGNEALDYLHKLDKYLTPTTMYFEAGSLPVIETPLSGAQSIHDMLLQSWGGIIRVFPAVPDDWAEVAFRDFSAEGAFRVTARRDGGKTRFFLIRSLAGEPCRVKTDLLRPARLLPDGEDILTPDARGVLELDLQAGEDVVLVEAGTRPEQVIAPVPGDPERANSFGLKAPSDGD